MGGAVDWEYVLADYMVEAQVHLIKGESLLKVTRVHCTEILIQVAIVNLKTGKLRVLNTHVTSDHSQGDDMRLKSLKWARNSQLVIRVAVQNVDKLLLLHCANHDGTALRIGCQVLAWDNATHTCLAESLLMDLDEAI